MTSNPSPEPAHPQSLSDPRCWVICPHDPATSPGLYSGSDDGAIPHYPSREDALAAISDLVAAVGSDLDEDAVTRVLGDRPRGDLGGVPIQLPAPCYIHSCDSCQESFTDDDLGGALHWLSSPAAVLEAYSAGWTTDGRDWHCTACPSFEAADALDQVAADAARQPGSQDQMLPGMGITSADVDVLGPAGVIPAQATTPTRHAADHDDEDGVSW
jgi:hypothetical protein